MADVKISALPLATTPLAGTEVLPIVQSATTDQVTVANLTAGRAVSASSLTLTTTPLAVGSGGTGLNTLAAGYIPYGNGTSAFSSSSALQFDGSGLGIGTANSFDTSPAGTGQYPLFGTWSLSTNLIQSAIGLFSDAANSATAIFLKSRGTSLGANVAVVNGDGIGTLTFRGADGTNYRNVASIAVSVDGPVSTGIVSGRIVFNTADTSGTNTERMRLDNAGNLGLGVTPKAEGLYYRSFELGKAGCGVGAVTASLTGNEAVWLASNVYPTYSAGTVWKYGNAGEAARLEVLNGAFNFYTAPSGSADGTITFTQPMTLDANGNLLVGTTSNTYIAKTVIFGGFGATIASTYTLSNTAVKIAAGVGLLFIVRDTVNGNIAIVGYENTLTPSIIYQSSAGKYITTGTPTGTQILLANASGNAGVQASTAAGAGISVSVANIGCQN